MTEFTGKAFPTTYRGRQYRSRLEARWAAFFDALAWPHEYEPVDLGSWSPDFLLPRHRCLVEIKPLATFDESVATKLTRAREQNLVAFDGKDAVYDWLLICGVAPQKHARGALIGWKYAREDGWREALIGWTDNWNKPTYDADVIDYQEDGWLAASGNAGIYSQMHHPPPRALLGYTLEKWSAASNLVQWNAK